MPVAIRVENLSKSYRITRSGAGRPQGYRTLREDLASWATAPLRAFRNGVRPEAKEDFWALRNLAFEVPRGEVVGIIGRNGAGKSTLLKILSRITEPTTGRVTIHGRVGSLLEVGTGFHPELTGRENIYLNGAILGMKRAEIHRKFDEIVAFAEVERFLDTPVKHYSSGMYMRLAFAVAAHLEPEILVVDEVLAVGDAQFQKKCLGKMQDVAHHGRTILFVSHNMVAITRLCSRCILLDEGRVLEDGPSVAVAATYMHAGSNSPAAREWTNPRRAPGNDIARLRSARMVDEQGNSGDVFDIRRPLGIEFTFDVLQEGHVLNPNFHLFFQDGTHAFATNDQNPKYFRNPRPRGRYTSTAWIPGNFLSEGTYYVSVALSTIIPLTLHFWERDALSFRVVDPMQGDSVRGDYVGEYPGVIRPLLEWSTRVEPLPSESTTARVLVEGPTR